MGSSDDNSSSLEISDQVQNAVVVIETSTVGSILAPPKQLPPVPPKSPRVLAFKLKYKNRCKGKSSNTGKAQNKELLPVMLEAKLNESILLEQEESRSLFYEDVIYKNHSSQDGEKIEKEQKLDDAEADKEVNLILNSAVACSNDQVDNDNNSDSGKDDDLTEKNEDTSASSSWDSDMTTENENGIVVGTMTVTPFPASASTHATATASTVQCPPPPIPRFPHSDPELESSSASTTTTSSISQDGKRGHEKIRKEKTRIYDTVPFTSVTPPQDPSCVKVCRPLPIRPDVEGKGVEEEDLENSFTDSLSEEHNYQNVTYQKSVEERNMNNFFDNPPEITKDTAVKSIFHNANGVTTIEMDPTNPAPVIHAVINLPPRRASLIKKRRRTEDLSYQKAARLSQIMMADYKAGGIDRPGGSGSTLNLGKNTNNKSSKAIGINALIPDKARARLSRSGILVASNVEKVGKSMSSVKKKVGSWYSRRVKTPVETLSSELGLDSIKLPMTMSFSFGSSNNNDDNESRGRRSRSASTARDFNGDEIDGISATNLQFASDKDFENKRLPIPPIMLEGQNEFEDLRRVVKQGGDFCKDLAAVLHERSELEAQYAKGLSKLSAKLLKASKEATGSVAHAWQAVAVQIDTQAELHRQWSTALSEEVARPLRNSTETQHKIRKSVEVLVEKTTRNLAEWRTAETKAKRQCFSSSKEFEKLQESTLSLVGSTTLSNNNHSNGNNNTNANNNSVMAEVRARSRILSVPPLEKDPIKLEAKRRKAEEAVRRADIEYYTFCVRSERARLEWEGAIRNGSTCLRTLEEEKLSLLRDLAVKYFQHLNDLAPKLVQSAESLEEPVKNCSVDQDMHSIVDIRRHAGAEQLLPDFYAEDTSNLMKKDRRKEALQKFLYLIKQDLEREKKGAVGVETLAKAIAEAPKIDNAHHDISDKLYYMKSMLLYLEASRCKLDNAYADVEGRQRSNNPITQYMRHQRDKQGLPQTILKVPSWARDECLLYSSGNVSVGGGAGSAGSSSPDWNDRGNGDGTSNQHDTDFDEFSSEGSENIEVFDEESKAANLISVPSIGRCRVIYDYDANMFDELTIRTGDCINIHDKQEDGWWLGELNGMIGIFPATYVEELPTEQPPE